MPVTSRPRSDIAAATPGAQVHDQHGSADPDVSAIWTFTSSRSIDASVCILSSLEQR